MIDLRGLPDFLTRDQAIKVGIFPSGGVEFRARRSHSGPHFIKMGFKIMYPKKFLIKYLQNNEIDYLIEEEYEL